MMFCMTIMYSVSCPLITPFGTLYFVTKHYVDRHNLMYAYKPSKINKKVHATAIGFVILGTVILQFFMMIFRSAHKRIFSLLFLGEKPMICLEGKSIKKCNTALQVP